MEKPSRHKRIQVMLADEELAAIDDWRFANRMPNRTAAVRDLLRRGLAIERPVRSMTGPQSKN
jgi:metal-responsive CopG/Arc/MetJ family transcriptional regulator